MKILVKNLKLLSFFLLIVISIVLILPFFGKETDYIEKSEAARLELIAKAISRYSIDEKRLPSNDEGIRPLLFSTNSKTWNGPYLPYKTVPLDFWSNPFIYKLSNNRCFELYSIGKNGIDESGAGDDVYITKCMTN